jgi:hypothetical protein
MQSKELINDLIVLIEKHRLNKTFNSNSRDLAIAMINAIDSNKTLLELNKTIDDSEVEFINRMYSMYPNKCPKRGVSLGKSRKDKERIRKLIKTYSMEEIERVFNYEIEEKYGKQYMQNFSTFLNNFPDPNVMFSDSEEEQQIIKEDKLIINGQIYR